MHCHPENTKVMVWCGESSVFTSPSSQSLRPHVPTAHTAAPAAHSQSFVLLWERWERMFCGRGGFRGDLPIKCSSAGDFCTVGNLWNPLFSTIKYNQGEKREVGREWGSVGDSKHPPRSPFAHPGHVLSTSPEFSWTDSRTLSPAASSSCQHHQSVPTPGFLPLAGDSAAPAPWD